MKLLGGLLNGLDDLVVAGAAAEIVGEEEADALFRGVRLIVEKLFGGDDEAGGADAALEGGVFEERLLQGVEFAVAGDAFDGGDAATFGFDSEDQAGGDDVAVENDSAGAAVAVVAAFLGTREADDVAEDFEETLARLAEEVDLLAVDGGGDAGFG